MWGSQSLTWPDAGPCAEMQKGRRVAMCFGADASGRGAVRSGEGSAGERVLWSGACPDQRTEASEGELQPGGCQVEVDFEVVLVDRDTFV